ncbi:MAG: UvrD-helicase domain-containing protein [Patescibacteria group bacterium]
MNPLYQDLNKEQMEAVDYSGGPILIVAGAGSGKTRVLTSRLMAILRAGAAPDSVIAITFTNKAAEEMRNRITNDLRLMTNNTNFVTSYKSFVISPFIGTFHSFGARILKKEARLVGRGANFSIFDEDDVMKVIKNIVKNFNLPAGGKNLSPVALRREFSRVKNELADIEEENKTTKYLYKEYESALVENNAFDFDDLIEKPARLFLENKNILEKYQNQFQHILVDEFQDTNIAQYFLIKLLAEKHKNLSVVGDDQQSIYKFRGSDYRNFLNFENDWPKIKVVLLEQNYRSSGNIIATASALIKNNKFQKRKNLWTENLKGELVKIIECKNEDEEGLWIADKISNNPQQLVAVLYRTNAQSRAIESALIDKGIAYRIFGGIKFYERKEIKDILAGLRWAANPNDSVSLERLKKNLLKGQFKAVYEGLSGLADRLKPTEMIDFFLEATNYFTQLKKEYLNYEERFENIQELVRFASSFDNLSDFLERVSLFQSTDIINDKSKVISQKSNVFLMTVHLAKGLEFDAVFIAGCNEGLMPHQMSYYRDEEIEEERRLMYVAMTRAKKELFISFYNMPSRFLYELPPELIEFTGERSLDDEERYISID